MKKAFITLLEIAAIGIACMFLPGTVCHAASQTDSGYTAAEQEAGNEIEEMVENGTFDSSELTKDQISYITKKYGDDPQALQELERQSDANGPSLAAINTSGYTHDAKFNGYTVKNGIDISRWQGTIDWSKVKADGVEFAIIRVAYRGSSNGSLNTDLTYATNLKGAIAAGLDVGVYIYSQATTVAEAVEEADYVINLVQGYDLHLPIVMDYEYYKDSYGYGRLSPSTSNKAAICNAFCAEVEKYNYTAMVYANKSLLNDDLATASTNSLTEANALATNYQIWLAHFTKKTDYTGTYSYWQYSSTGSVSGISGNVDMDFRYITTPSSVTNLTQTVTSETSITLNWTRVAGVYGYYITRLNETTGAYELVGTTTGASQTTFTDTSANTAVTNVYKVESYYKLNSGNYYSGDPFAVNNPVSNFAASATTDSSITLTWDAQTNVSGYEITRLNTETNVYETIATINSPTTNSYEDTGLSAGTTYFYQIRSYYTDGITTTYYDYDTTVIADTDPGKPTGLTLTAASKSITLSWNQQAGVSGYKIYVKKKGKWKKIATVKGEATTTYKHTGLTANTAYTYSIVAYYKKNGVTTDTNRSDAATAMTLAPAIKGFTATAKTKTSIRLSWRRASNINGYIIYMKTDEPDAVWKRVKTITSASKTAWTKKNLSSSTNYQFMICAYKTYDNVVYTGKTKTISKRIQPAKITDVKIKTYGSRQLLSWPIQDGVTGYYVYQRNTSTGDCKRIATIMNSSQSAYIIDAAASGKYTYHVTAYCVVGKKVTKGKRSAAATVTTEQQTLTANASKLNLRKKAKTTSKVLARLSKGKTMTVKSVTVNKYGRWYKVSYQKGSKTYTGYVSADYVSVN